MTLSILDIKKSIFAYSSVIIFLVVLNYIYSLFSHEVSSNYMTYMFIYPLIGGLFVHGCAMMNKKMTQLQSFYIGKCVLNYGIATFVVGSFMKGVFEIAGTDSSYLIYYVYIGLLLVGIGVMFIINSFYQSKRNY